MLYVRKVLDLYWYKSYQQLSITRHQESFMLAIILSNKPIVSSTTHRGKITQLV